MYVCCRFINNGSSFVLTMGEFIPTLDEGDFCYSACAKTGTTLTKTIATTTKIEQIILKIFQKLIKL
jgi:cobalt-zinc-cadmium resistance protein CzcA